MTSSLSLLLSLLWQRGMAMMSAIVGICIGIDSNVTDTADTLHIHLRSTHPRYLMIVAIMTF